MQKRELLPHFNPYTFSHPRCSNPAAIPVSASPPFTASPPFAITAATARPKGGYLPSFVLCGGIRLESRLRLITLRMASLLVRPGPDAPPSKAPLAACC